MLRAPILSERDLPRAIDALALEVAAHVHGLRRRDGTAVWPWTDSGGEGTGALFRFVRALLGAYLDASSTSDRVAAETSLAIGATARRSAMSPDDVITSATRTLLSCESAIDEQLPWLALMAAARAAHVNSLVCRACVVGLCDASIEPGIRPRASATQRLLVNS